MGFTRYFEGNVTLTAELIEDIQNIVKNSGVKLAGWDGEGEPNISTTEIRFNGSNEDEESCETFIIENGFNSGFCKTAQYSYDVVVANILRRLEETQQDFSASSDGDDEEEKINSL